MKDLKIILKYFLLGVFCSVCMVFGWYVGKKGKNTEYVTDTITVELCDTVTDFQLKYVTLDHYDTVELPVLVSDTIIDTISVQIPINTYVFTDTIQDSNYQANFKAVCRGFDVSMDSLLFNINISQQQPPNTSKKWYQHIGPAVGVGYGTSGLGIFIGIGYDLN